MLKKYINTAIGLLCIFAGLQAQVAPPASSLWQHTKNKFCTHMGCVSARA
jgi:hypothetical protein